MAFIFQNPNPQKKLVGDCVIRAISITTGKSWQDVFIDLMIQSFMLCDVPTSNFVWGSYLHDLGYQRKIIPDTCPDCYTVEKFAEDHKNGRYVLGTGTHAIAVVSGNYLDTWDSGQEIPIYYWKLEE